MYVFLVLPVVDVTQLRQLKSFHKAYTVAAKH